MVLFSEYSYLKQNRLSDVVRLISVLAVETRWSYRQDKGLNDTLNGKPKSGENWFEIAKEHPEFFKFNNDENAVVLLLRFLNRTGEKGKEEYPAFTIDQTQKLIDQAILLHDKQIGRLQKNSFLVPILTAIITALATGLISYLTLTSNNASIKQVEKKIDSLTTTIDEKLHSKTLPTDPYFRAIISRRRIK
jgi:hypothetical protein